MLDGTWDWEHSLWDGYFKTLIIIIIIIIIIVIIKTSSTGTRGKNKIAYKLLSQPHKHLRHGKLKNKDTEATNDWLLALAHQRSGVKNGVGKVIPHASLGR